MLFSICYELLLDAAAASWMFVTTASEAIIRPSEDGMFILELQGTKDLSLVGSEKRAIVGRQEWSAHPRHTIPHQPTQHTPAQAHAHDTSQHVPTEPLDVTGFH